MKLAVIAKGIERPEQHRILLDLGCAFGQGYLFDKVLDARSFAASITSRAIDRHGISISEAC